MADCDLQDVAIVGGGLAGSIAAALLGSSGIKTTMIDLRDVYPPDFRAEQIVGVQVDTLRRLGLIGPVASEGVAVRQIVNVRKGRTLDVTANEQYGLLYEDIVAQIRSQIPPSVTRLTGKVTAVETSDDTQSVTLADGRTLEARLIVIATGLNAALSRSLGITRNAVRDCHSVSLGFDMETDAPDTCEAMTYYGERLGDGIDYLSLFRVPGTLRGNLFVYWPAKDTRLQRFKAEPAQVLKEALPGLAKVIGDFRINRPVQLRPVDLYKVEGHLQAGLVMAGDAFQTSCPAAGTGIERLLSDVEQLCTVHVPAWLATPGMAVDKIAAFYANPAKLAADAWASHVAEYRRAVTTDLSLRWHIHRAQVNIRRRLAHMLSRATSYLPHRRRSNLAMPPMGGMAPRG